MKTLYAPRRTNYSSCNGLEVIMCPAYGQKLVSPAFLSINPLNDFHTGLNVQCVTHCSLLAVQKVTSLTRPVHIWTHSPTLTSHHHGLPVSCQNTGEGAFYTRLTTLESRHVRQAVTS